jgi:hypothetical protein
VSSPKTTPILGGIRDEVGHRCLLLMPDLVLFNDAVQLILWEFPLG